MTTGTLAIDLVVQTLTEIHAGRFDEAAQSLRRADAAARMACEELGYRFVPEAHMGALADAVAKLTKRAIKLGQPSVGYAVHGHELRPVTRHGYTYNMPFVMLSLTGEAPTVNGARLLARIEHTEAGNIVSAAPGVTPDPDWHTVDARCEHCNTLRRRIDTFAVEVEGTVKLVGRNCLADFVRSADVETALSFWKFLQLFSDAGSGSGEEYEGGGSYRYTGPTPAWFVACAARAIRAEGYIKRGSDNQCTADVAGFASGPCPNSKAAKEWHAIQPTECDISLAARAVAWISETTDAVGFLANARVICGLPYLKSRNMGIAAAIAQTYRRELERQARAAQPQPAPAPAATATHFGEVSQRYELTGLRVLSARARATDYGTQTIVKLEDSAGHRFVWFASGMKTYEPGQILSGRATVKKHTTSDKFGQETVLTRATLDLQASAA